MNEVKSGRIFLKSVRVQGFRSLYDVSLNPGQINILVGANGSGKTNLMLLFRFLHDIVASPTAIWRYLSRAPSLIWHGAEESDRAFQATFWFGYSDGRTLCYDMTVSSNLTFIREELKEEQDSGRTLLLRNHRRLELCTAQGGKKIVSVQPNRISLSVLHEVTPLDEHEAIPEIGDLIEFIQGWRIVWINTSKARKSLARQISVDCISDNVPPLKPSGENLAEFLHALLKNRPEDYDLIAERLRAAMNKEIRGFSNATAWGAIKTLVFEESSHGSYHLSPREEPGSVIRLLAVFSLLFGDRSASLICLEEPDRGLHPQIMIHLADALRYYEVTKKPYPQIFVTTHNPIFLNCFDLLRESAYLRVFVVERNQRDGKTEIRLVNPQEVGEWLEERSLGDLYTSGILEI